MNIRARQEREFNNPFLFLGAAQWFLFMTLNPLGLGLLRNQGIGFSDCGFSTYLSLLVTLLFVLTLRCCYTVLVLVDLSGKLSSAIWTTPPASAQDFVGLAPTGPCRLEFSYFSVAGGARLFGVCRLIRISVQRRHDIRQIRLGN